MATLRAGEKYPDQFSLAGAAVLSLDYAHEAVEREDRAETGADLFEREEIQLCVEEAQRLARCCVPPDELA